MCAQNLPTTSFLEIKRTTLLTCFNKYLPEVMVLWPEKISEYVAWFQGRYYQSSGIVTGI
jgi:hypothetical protein